MEIKDCLYYSILEQEQEPSQELWVRRNGTLNPVFDYKISNGDQIRLISDPEMNIQDAVSLGEVIDYVHGELNPGSIPLLVIDELTDQNLDIEDRFEHKLIFKICN